jgi:hypothetical protein
MSRCLVALDALEFNEVQRIMNIIFDQHGKSDARSVGSIALD